MFEEHCHNLDVDIVKERIEAEEADSTRTNFDCQVAAEANRKDQLQEQLHQKHLELDKLEEEMPLNQLHDPGSDGANMVQQLRTDIFEMVRHDSESTLFTKYDYITW